MRQVPEGAFDGMISRYNTRVGAVQEGDGEEGFILPGLGEARVVNRFSIGTSVAEIENHDAQNARKSVLWGEQVWNDIEAILGRPDNLGHQGVIVGIEREEGMVPMRIVPVDPNVDYELREGVVGAAAEALQGQAERQGGVVRRMGYFEGLPAEGSGLDGFEPAIFRSLMGADVRQGLLLRARRGNGRIELMLHRVDELDGGLRFSPEQGMIIPRENERLSYVELSQNDLETTMVEL